MQNWFSDDGLCVPPPSLAAQLACLLEVMARKPGNVSPVTDFSDLTAVDFQIGAIATGYLPRDQATEIGVVVGGIIGFQEGFVQTNANLGVALLIAPLAIAHPWPWPPNPSALRSAWKRSLDELLARTTIADAVKVYEAIRLAQPGGLGSAAEQDLAHQPTVSLLECMKLAKDRDLIARQYANGFADIFERGVDSLRDASVAGLTVEEGVIFTHLRFIAVLGDSLIERKCGKERSAEARKHAQWVLEAGWPNTSESQMLFRRFDGWLRQDGNRLNPGATADLVAATLFVALGSGSIPLPLKAPWASQRL